MAELATVQAPSRRLVAGLIVLLSALWGSTWVVIEFGLRDVPPYTAVSARFLLAAAAMTAVAPLLARREGGGRPPLWLSFVVGVTSFTMNYALVYYATARLPSGVVSVLWAVFPIMMALSSSWFLAGDPLRARQWLGFVLAFAGVGVLFMTDLRNFGPEGVPTALVLLLAPLVSCVGTTVLKLRGKGVSAALLNRDAMWIGLAGLVVLTLVEERHAEAHWTAQAIGSVVYLALVGTVLAFTLYFWLLRHAEAWRLSVIAYLTPAIALVMGTLVGGEPFTVWTLTGSLTILVGVVLATLRRPAR
jgi:drug/metabolite transporter (DMT)-like permease